MASSAGRRSTGWIRELPLLAPFVIAAGFAMWGRPLRAAVVAAIGMIVVAVRLAAGPARFHRGVATVGRLAERVLAVLGTTTVWVLAVAPAWAVGRLGRRRARVAAWERVGAGDTRRRPFGPPPPSVRSRSALSRAATAVGTVTLLLTVDLLVGLAWDQVNPSRPGDRMVGRIGSGDGEPVDDPRAEGVALRDSPWGAQHLIDLQRTPYTYWPFTLTRPRDFQSPTITLEGWERATHQSGLRSRAPVTIALFGGSAAFGEGQRDQGTIASFLVRLAEADGVAIDVDNFGQRGFVSWQEALLFEQLTAEGDRPDLAVFYDGGNDVATQYQPSTAGFPTHYDVDAVSQILTGTDAGGGETRPRSPRWGDVWEAYRQNSALHRAGRELQAWVRGSPAGAQQANDWRTLDPSQVGLDAAAIYRRARTFIIDTAEARGITPVHYWQPVRSGSDPVAYASALSAIGPPTLDISGILRGRDDVFLDDLHTNEEGAEIVARQMWADLRPLVADIEAGRSPRAPTTDERLRGGRDAAELETAQRELANDLLPDDSELGPGWSGQGEDQGTFIPECASAQDRGWNEEVVTGVLTPILARTAAPPLTLVAFGLRTEGESAAAELAAALSSDGFVACMGDALATVTGEPRAVPLAAIEPPIATVAGETRAWRGVASDRATEHVLVITRDGTDVGVWQLLGPRGVPDAEIAAVIEAARS